MKRVIVILWVLIAGQAFSQNSAKVTFGEKAADFTLKTLMGMKYS